MQYAPLFCNTSGVGHPPPAYQPAGPPGGGQPLWGVSRVGVPL